MIGLLQPGSRLVSGHRRRIAVLARVRDSRRQLIAACPGHGRAEDCPILNALSQESRP
jgi:MerR family copper efflux transcriptional regulator